MATERVALPVKLPFDFARHPAHHDLGLRHRLSMPALSRKYWFERFARLPVEIDVASEFRYREAPLAQGRSGDLHLAVGRDRRYAGGAALRQGAGRSTSLSVVNVPTSTIARESETVLPTLAGPEIGVASTKAFTCQLTVLACLAIAAGKARGDIVATTTRRKLVHGADRSAAPDGGGADARAADREAGARPRQVHATCSISAAAPAIRWRWKAR